MKYFPAIVVGAGLAGMRAAIALNQKNLKVAILTKVHPLRSHSIAAQGGINAALRNHPRGGFDSPKLHAFDTVKGSDYLADQPAALKMTTLAPEIIYEMEHWGCPFSRDADGRIAQRPFGGAGFPRTAYATDKTGHVLLHTLYEQVVRYELGSERNEMTVLEEWAVLRLVIDAGECVGVIAMNVMTGEVEAFRSEVVIFATGGSGRVYGNSTNAVISTGLGQAIPYWAGVPLKDMEFVQFHPTTLVGTNILMTEGCRGEGGFLLNNKGERFLANYPDSAKAMEVAPRDIVARNIGREILAGRGFENAYVHLDIRHLGEQKIRDRLPGIRDLSINFVGVDPIQEPIPVQPGQHYTMGGIDTNENGETPVKGFYAAGECACVSVHGANRLGGNSLLETLVFGKVAGEHAGDYIQSKTTSNQGISALNQALDEVKGSIEELKSRPEGESPAALRDELGAAMKDGVGLFREEATLTATLQKVKDIQARYRKISLNDHGLRANYDLLWALELKGNIDVAETIVAGAVARKESRGSQFRTDFPTRDDANFLKHTMATWTGSGAALDYAPVALGMWEPKERKY